MPTPDLPIRTGRLLLRAFEPADLDALHDFRGRPDVARYLLAPAQTRAQTAAMLERRIAHPSWEKPGDGVGAAVVRDGELIGDVSLEWESAEHAMAEIGFVFRPDSGGRGYATEAARAFIDMGFPALGLHRVVGRCDACNDASARVLRRLGMRQEAHFVRNEWIQGEWTDELVFAVLVEEWRAAAPADAPSSARARPRS